MKPSPDFNFMGPPLVAAGDVMKRRTFLARAGASIGGMALASLFQSWPRRAFGAGPATESWPGILAARHVAPRAKRVIFLCMAGGPSHLETFDEKPELQKLHGQPMPASFTTGQPIAQLQGKPLNCFGPRFEFQRRGVSGQNISSVLPHIGSIADDLCILRSLHTEQINHDPAHTFLSTGTAISGRPSLGSWVLYGLGSEGQDLPGFVVLTSVGGGQDQPIAARQWHSGFLPGSLQGVHFHSKGDPVLYVNRPGGVSAQNQREVVDAVNTLNLQAQRTLDDPEISARVRQYEMAFRMQASVPELMDVSGEPPSIVELYGAKPGDGSFASNCLLARRLAERGVRFVQLYHRGWDHHGEIKKGIEKTAGLVDRASAALVVDLKQRGMLDDTLVVWGGEFGRTPMAQGTGRDHHIRGYSMWMAGGGVKAGISYGATDELGYHSVEDRMHVHDLHATMLHLLGIDHKQLTFRYQGRDFRLTDVQGEVVHRIIG